MKKKSGILFFLLFLGAIAVAQQENGSKGFDKSRLFVGGNLGLSFSSYSTAVNLSPQVGYFFTPHLAAGVGINFAYYRYNIYTYNNALLENQTYSYTGLNVFGRYYPIRQAFIHMQPELNYVWGSYAYAGQPAVKVGTTVPSFLVGAGAAIPAGRGSLVISLMYDLVQNSLSPYYHQAVYGFGYTIGL